MVLQSFEDASLRVSNIVNAYFFIFHFFFLFLFFSSGQGDPNAFVINVVVVVKTVT